VGRLVRRVSKQIKVLQVGYSKKNRSMKAEARTAMSLVATISRAGIPSATNQSPTAAGRSATILHATAYTTEGSRSSRQGYEFAVCGACPTMERVHRK
jgi:hypothetical protein